MKKVVADNDDVGTVQRRSGTLADLLLDRIEHADELLRDTFRTWGVHHADLHGRHVAERVGKVWRRWPLRQQVLLLRAAESLARAENVKRGWSPTASRPRYLRLSKSGSDAARLAREIAAMFPPPWAGDGAAVKELVTRLFEYAKNVMEVTSFVEADRARRHAGVHLELLQAEASRYSRRLPWDVLRELVWLAGGKQTATPPDESTIRRYSANRRSSRIQTPAASHWKRNWHLGAVGRLVPETRRHMFDTLLQNFLNVSASSAQAAHPRRQRPLEEGANDGKSRLGEARALRATLTRQFQAAKDQGSTIFRAEVKAEIDDRLPMCLPEERKVLLSKIQAAGPKPSDAAARISAKKYGLALRDVRKGSAPRLPRRRIRRMVFVPDLVASEEMEERHRRGGPRRPRRPK